MKKVMSVADIAEVQEFELVEENMRAFMQEHAAVFETYQVLADERNAALERADKAVRALDEVECGQWKIASTAEKINNEKLFELIGEKKFCAIGGRIVKREETDYVLDKAMVLAALAKNKVSIEDAKTIGAYKKEVRYKAPKPVVL